MKRLLIFSLSLLLFACSKDDDTDFIEPVNHTVSVHFDENYDNRPAEGAQVELVNSQDGNSYSLTTNAAGEAETEVVPGTYRVTVSQSFTPEEYLEFAGQQVEENVVFNGSMSSVSITANSTVTEVELITGTIGNLVIKQVYQAGSDIRLGAGFRDQFVEIHNNSNETIYLDGLHFAQVYGIGSVPSNPREYHLANGQLDWSQAIGQPDAANANSGYVYLEEIIRIPGSGEDHPLASGQSVIIAATAINHKAPLTVTDDEGVTETIEVPEPERTIDLSDAPFEAYFRTYQESQGNTWLDTDIDNPDSENLEVVFKSYGGKDLILDPLGRDAFVIFFAEETELNELVALPSPSVGVDDFSETTNTYLQVPNELILDGVEVQRNDPSRGKPKRLPDAVDAGEIAGIQGAYSSESLIRKISKEVDGKVFYQDTNNSSVDFQVLTHPEVE